MLATARVPPGQSVTMQGVMAGRVARIGELQVTCSIAFVAVHPSVCICRS